jgi:hypothetical protein
LDFTVTDHSLHLFGNPKTKDGKCNTCSKVLSEQL